MPELQTLPEESYNPTNAEVLKGREIVVSAVREIHEIQTALQASLGLGSDSPELAQETDDVLAEIAIQGVTHPSDPHGEALQKIETALIEAALEASGERPAAQHDPAEILEARGYNTQLTAAIEDLHSNYATTPKGEDVAELVAEKIEERTKEHQGGATGEILQGPKHSERMGALTQELLSAIEQAGNERASNRQDQLYARDQAQLRVLNDLSVKIRQVRDQELSQDLANGSFSLEEFSDLLSALRQAQDFVNYRTYVKEGKTYTEERRIYGDTLMVFDKVPAETVSAMYHSSRDSESGNLKYLLRQTVLNSSESSTDLYTAAQLMSKIHGVPMLQLRNSRAAMDPIVRAACGRTEFGMLMMSTAEKPRDNREYAVFTRDIRDNQIALLRQFGLPDHIAHLASRAINERTMEKDENGRTRQGQERCVNIAEVREVLSDVRYVISQAGIETVTRASERWGLVNFANYSADQLRRMSDLAEEKPELIEYLQQGDVTVVFTDALGDHNGAFSENGEKFEKISGRTLFFEIHSPQDYYKYLAQLKRMGIRPSTVVVANHGSPGGMGVGEGTGRFSLTNQHPDDARQRLQEINENRKEKNEPKMQPPIILLDAKGLEVIAQRYMQPGKGVDDEKGAISFILLSCSQAQRRQVTRQGPDGRPVSVGESSAETLMRQLNARGADPRVRAYATSVSSNMSRTEGGLRYNKELAHEFTTDKGGNIIERTIEIIPYDSMASARNKEAA